MDLDLSTLINNAFIYYDKQNIEYDEYIKSNNITVERETNKIIFNDNSKELNSKELKYEFLGIFDNTTNIWIWAWLVPEFMFNETNISRKLLNYGLKISPTPINKLDNEQLYLKTQMVNSRFLLYDQFQLDLHLAISSYLAKDSFKFIYSKRKYLNKEKSKYITVYYLIF
jgi:hypothetical protein